MKLAGELNLNEIDEHIRFLHSQLSSLIAHRYGAESAGAPQFGLARYLKLRRFRDNLFPAGLFADPAWDILLELFVAERDGKSISVSSACMGSSVPPTTALRYIRKLEELCLVERHAHPKDGRRVDLLLTDSARRALTVWEHEARNAKTIRRRELSEEIVPRRNSLHG